MLNGGIIQSLLAAVLLATRYQQVSAHAVHGDWLTLLEPWLLAAPRRLLDVGAGSGRDAAFLAELHQGNMVVAAEPCQALAAQGKCHTREAAVAWVNDAMPALLRDRYVRSDFAQCCLDASTSGVSSLGSGTSS